MDMIMPSVCAIGDDSIQFEWDSETKHLELEFTTKQTICFLKEEKTSQDLASLDGWNATTEVGECTLGDWEKVRQLLNWFAEEEKP